MVIGRIGPFKSSNDDRSKACETEAAMKLGIVIYSDEVETVWNAFRLGVFALKKGDSVQVFLLRKRSRM